MGTALALGGIVAPILDVVVIAGLGALQPGYSHVRQFISELGETGRPLAAIANAWFVIVSLLLSGFAVALLARTRSSWISAIGALLFAVWAATGVIGGLFPCDPGCRGETTAGAIHVILGIIGAVCVLPVPALLWWGVRDDRQWQGYGWFTLAIQIVLLTSLALLGAVQVGHSPWAAALEASVGLLQRISLGAIYVWTAAIGLAIVRTSRATQG